MYRGMPTRDCSRHHSTAYPTICVNHLEVVEDSRLPNGVSRLEGNDPLAVWGPPSNISYSMAYDEEEDFERRFKLIRRFADKAGAVKLSTKAMERLGTQFAQLGSALMRDAIIELVNCEDRTFPRNDHVDLFNIAPPAQKRRAIECSLPLVCVQHVIVPRQICQSQVYRQLINPGGSFPSVDAEWIPRDDSSVENERKEAISAYDYRNFTTYRMEPFEKRDAESLFPEEDSSSDWSAADDDEEDLGWVDDNVDSSRMESFEESDADDALFPEEESSSDLFAAYDYEEQLYRDMPFPYFQHRRRHSTGSTTGDGTFQFRPQRPCFVRSHSMSSMTVGVYVAMRP